MVPARARPSDRSTAPDAALEQAAPKQFAAPMSAEAAAPPVHSGAFPAPFPTPFSPLSLMSPDESPPTEASGVEAFVERWREAQGSERSNGQSFVRELTALVGAATPGVATGDPAADDYVFERPVRFLDGPRQTVGSADLYRRGAVMLETKQGVDAERAAAGKRPRRGHGVRGTGAWGAVMEAAKEQAARYARNLEPAEPVPPVPRRRRRGVLRRSVRRLRRVGPALHAVPEPGDVPDRAGRPPRRGRPRPSPAGCSRTRSRWTPPGTRPAWRRRSRSGWRGSPRRWTGRPRGASPATRRGGRRGPSGRPGSSRGPCSACSPRTPGCCRTGRSAGSWRRTGTTSRTSRPGSRRSSGRWTRAGTSARSGRRCRSSTASCSGTVGRRRSRRATSTPSSTRRRWTGARWSRPSSGRSSSGRSTPRGGGTWGRTSRRGRTSSAWSGRP